MMKDGIPKHVIPGEGREGHLDASPPHTHYISLLTDLHQSRLSLPGWELSKNNLPIWRSIFSEILLNFKLSGEIKK